MASAVFIDAIVAVPGRLELKPVCSKTTAIKALAKELESAVGGHKKDCETFALKLITALKSALEIKQPTALSKRRELLWARYACMRTKKLPILWEAFLQKIGCSQVNSEPLVMELVNETILEELISDTFPSGEETSPEIGTVTLTKDEANIIRYACGYVAMKLHKRFLKEHGDKAARFVVCLDCFHADGPSSSLLNYTKEWVQRVNRGGLFDVSDDAFRLLSAIEIVMRKKLTDHLKSRSGSSDGKSSIIEYVTSNPDVQFYWSIIDVNLEDEESTELLTHVVKLWLNVRGFSVTNEWMETYKQTVCSETKKKRSLRKELKKQEQQKKGHN